MNALLAHLVGDYILQSDWMALNKTTRWFPAAAHALTYGLPFLLVTRSFGALTLIVASHAVIDRYRLAKYLVWAKNRLAPRSAWQPWSECRETGYHESRLPWMAVWLLIIADNTVHLAVNTFALSALG